MKLKIMLIALLLLIVMPIKVTIAQENQPMIPVITQPGCFIESGETDFGIGIGTDIPTGGIPEIGGFIQKVELTGFYSKRPYGESGTLYATRAFTVDQFNVATLNQNGSVFYAGYGVGWWHYLVADGPDDDRFAYRLELGFKFALFDRVLEACLFSDIIMEEVFTYQPKSYFPGFSLVLYQ